MKKRGAFLGTGKAGNQTRKADITQSIEDPSWGMTIKVPFWRPAMSLTN